MTDINLATRIGARVLQTRWLVRAPIWLYRAGLGFLVDSRGEGALKVTMHLVGPAPQPGHSA
ncbi:hypothetical protein [Nocardia callitridis]|uniref:hypothetical protein n=1 Tax=Nocardia callitridis TaxID=648753 RepID=UPI0031E8185E